MSHALPHGRAALPAGTWFKLICGASSHDVATIANLAEVYATAGVDCIDVAATSSVLHAATLGISRAQARGARPPLLMASISDGDDVHFRKAYFDPRQCPTDCPRPCEAVCPADAIDSVGVINGRCYGCGRCVPVCPLGLVDTAEVAPTAAELADVLSTAAAVEIHTAPHRTQAFRKLWETRGVGTAVAAGLRVIAVSLPDLGTDRVFGDALQDMWDTMKEAVRTGGAELIWQTDGRPMSGDIGGGTAHASVKLAQRVRRLLNERHVPGHVQLAGGTNWRTVPLMTKCGLLRTDGRAHDVTASGVAMGGYARKIVREALGHDGGLGEVMTTESFERAMHVALPLVQAVKGSSWMRADVVSGDTIMKM